MIIGIDATPATRKVKTGTEHYAEALILEFAKLKTDHKFILYSRYEPTGALAKLPANFSWKILPFPLLWSQVRLSWEFMLHPKAVDVMFFPAHVMPVITPKRSVITLHDIGFEHFPELYANHPIGPSMPFVRWPITLGVLLATGFKYRNNELDYHRWATRFALKKATRVLTVSEATKRDIVQHFHPKTDPVVTHNGFDATGLKPAKLSTLPAEVQERAPYLLFIGRIEAKKNVVTLVKAFGKLAEQNAKLNLVLMGRPGFGYADVADAIQALPESTRTRIHELGYLSDGMKRAWLQGAALFTFPSAFEGFGIPPLEAMACGVPVVAANGTSLPEVVGDAGKLVPTHDVNAWVRTIADLLKDEKTQQTLRTRGFERIKSFGWDKCAAQTLGVLEEAGKHE